MKFTFEAEDLHRSSFLDDKTTCKNKWFVTSVFYNALFSGVFMNYDFICFLPVFYKFFLFLITTR